MRKHFVAALWAFALGTHAMLAMAEPALDVLGRDFTFPLRIGGMPSKLSDFGGLQINTFVTNDGVKLAYWEAGHGKPLILVPGWSANGAQ